MLAGKWTYRSYLNRPALVAGDAAAALALIFGEGVFDFQEADADGSFRGALGMGAGYALTLTGRVDPDGNGFAIEGVGLDGAATAGWRYDYRGVLGHQWPDAIDQVPSLLGTVIRVAAHGPGAPAGVTASFIAVRGVKTGPGPARRNVLTAGL